MNTIKRLVCLLVAVWLAMCEPRRANNRLVACYWIEHKFQSCESSDEFVRDMKNLCKIHQRREGSALAISSYGSVLLGETSFNRLTKRRLKRGSLDELDGIDMAHKCCGRMCKIDRDFVVKYC